MKPYLFLLLLLSAFLLFFHLGTRPLLSSGEARASEIALEMLQRGNILIPYLNEEILLTKPVLFHWTIILSYKIFGVREFSSRVPSSLAGIFVIILVFLLGKRFWDKKTGFIAGLILLTSPMFFWTARCARIDSLLLFLITISIYCFWQGYEKFPKGKVWFLGLFLFMALGMLAKGPVGAVLPLVISVLFLLFTGKRNILKRLNWFWGIILFLIIVSPWFITIYSIVPQHKTELFFVQQNWVWFLGGGEWYKGYVYIPHLFLGFFPWSMVLPVVILSVWKNFRYRRDEKTVFLLIWVIVVFLLFYFTGKKVSRYILPLYPALSLLTANIISTKKETNRFFLFALVGVWSFVVLSVNLFDLYSRFLDPELVSIIVQYIDRLWITVIGLVIIILGLYGIKKSSFMISVIMTFVLFLMFVVYVIPIERDYYSPKPFCEMLKKEVPEGVRLRAYKSWDNTIRYYFGRHVDIMHNEDELTGFLGSPERVYCFMWSNRYEDLPEKIKESVFLIKKGYKVFERKVVLISNRKK